MQVMAKARAPPLLRSLSIPPLLLFILPSSLSPSITGLEEGGGDLTKWGPPRAVTYLTGDCPSPSLKEGVLAVRADKCLPAWWGVTLPGRRAWEGVPLRSSNGPSRGIAPSYPRRNGRFRVFEGCKLWRGASSPIRHRPPGSDKTTGGVAIASSPVVALGNGPGRYW